ncbi:NAC domain [Dillenia turbinata]|uniref:NAC domain n=1 Tax=Dillenia turbinata TaxID=194707 RepID=A0AAN8VP95_9MAGN
MGLRDIGATLPPGFRFYPSDEELVCHYLYKKIANEEVLKGTLVEIDLHSCEPWQLPEVAKLNANEWYFFSFRDRKYATGFRTNRATTSGYWKATGKDRTVVDPITRDIVGMRKTLVFYRNRAPNGIKTGWIMHEFRLESPHMPPREDWVLCRVFHKSKGEYSERLSPQNGTYETLDSKNNALSPTLAASPPTELSQQTTAILPCSGYQPMTSFCQNPFHNDQNQPQNSLLNLANLNPNFLHTFSKLEGNRPSHNEVSFRTGDDYGFLWDMNLEESLVDGVNNPSHMEDMRFNEDDNSMFFL